MMARRDQLDHATVLALRDIGNASVDFRHEPVFSLFATCVARCPKSLNTGARRGTSPDTGWETL
jgi:hypothetical protein